MDYIVDRCTSPTPYSHPPTRASDIVLLRFTDAVSESLGLQSNSSTTLSCAKPRPSPVTAKGKSLLRILQRFMPCISSTHHGNLESDVCAKKMSSTPNDDMSDKIPGEYEEATLADALIEHTPSVSRTPLETILEREEEYL
ncbi:hypothetical protein ID866_12203 [Astraeus odoratus]|nr:hypothetical protein ID866_12203 [Astraeus odoratus]